MHSWNPVSIRREALPIRALGFDGDGVVVVDGMNSTGAKVSRYTISTASMSRRGFRISRCTDEGDVNHS